MNCTNTIVGVCDLRVYVAIVQDQLKLQCPACQEVMELCFHYSCQQLAQLSYPIVLQNQQIPLGCKGFFFLLLNTYLCFQFQSISFSFARTLLTMACFLVDCELTDMILTYRNANVAWPQPAIASVRMCQD